MNINVKRRPFGGNGISVSEVSFGAMNLRMLNDVTLARKLVDDILDLGINCIDTARGYNSEPGAIPFIESEVIIGETLSARTDLTEPILIITKGHGYEPESFLQHLDESTRRLRITRRGGTLYIGQTEIRLCYLLHGISRDRWGVIASSGVLDYAKRLQAEGRFDFFGFSSHYRDADVIQEAIETGKFNACELPYNVYNTVLGEGGEVNLFKLAHEKGMGVVNMKAYNGNGSVAIFKQLSGLTGLGYVDMTRFCLSNPYTSTIDAGVRAVGEYLENAGASEMAPLTEGERAEMRGRAGLVSPHLSTICRECLHCVEKFECPQGVNFPRMLGVHGRYLVSKSLGFDVSGYKTEYASVSSGVIGSEYASAASGVASGSAGASGGECVKCGRCVPWCDYHLDVPALLATANIDLR